MKAPLKKMNRSKEIDQGLAFYQATQTGDKSNIKRVYKEALKEFGLIHLLTPSGIHLSSILGIFLVFLPRKYHIGIFLMALFTFITIPGLYSLKRVIYFQIITFFLKGRYKNQLGFVLTFLLDALLGGFIASPLSYAYSFLFWGVIIFSTSSTLKTILNLFFAQLIAVYFTSGSVNLFSIIINPILTAIYSFLFPLFSLNYWILDIDWLTSHIVELHILLLNLLAFIKGHLSLFLISSHPLILLLPIFSFNKKVISLFLLIFSLNLNFSSKSLNDTNVFYSLPETSEFLELKKNKIIFVDIKCNRLFRGSFWRYSCKERPSRYGGPVF